MTVASKTTSSDRRFRQYALRRVRALRVDTSIHAVLLAGSVARHETSAASDVDLHILHDGAEERRSEWTFRKSGLIEHRHYWSSRAVVRAWEAREDRDALARWLHRTLATDYLDGFEALHWRDSSALTRDALEELITLRVRPSIVRRLAMLYLLEAESYLDRTRRALDGSVEDAHQLLRHGVQQLLLAALVRLGWMVHGSKDRFERAEEYVTDVGVANCLELMHDVVGVGGATARDARWLSALRLDLRWMVLSELERRRRSLRSPKPETKTLVESIAQIEKAHNANARDYYGGLIEQGLIRGPINHLRCLSGFPRIPVTLLRAVQIQTRLPVYEFQTCKAISPTLRETWASIAALQKNRGVVERWSGAMVALVRSLRRTIG